MPGSSFGGPERPPSPSFIPNLRRLAYFLALAHERHFGRAAARLRIAQPGLSQQIRILEAEVGARLVDRTPGGTRLTLAGALLEQEAARILIDAQLAIERVRAVGAGGTDLLRVAYTRSATFLGTRDVVNEFRRRYPKVEVHTEVAWTSYNLALLRDGRADAVFVRPPIDEPGVEVLSLVTEELVVALPPGHHMLKQRLIAPSDLRDEPVVLWPRAFGPGYYDCIVCQIWNGAQPRIALEEPDDDQILSAVAEGIGLAVVELHRVAHLRPDGISIRRFTEPRPTTSVGVAWRSECSSPVLSAFIDACRGMQAPPADIVELDSGAT